jgi:dipeptidyl aminopeptidase/acylaminoacyl peptidase
MGLVLRSVRVVFLACLALCAAGPVTQARADQPFGVEDLVRLERISEPAASPDGSHIAYTLRTTDIDANKGRTGVWWVDARAPAQAPRRLTDIAANAGAAAWSADGRYLSYLSNRSGTNQVWRSAITGADPVEVTRLPLDV